MLSLFHLSIVLQQESLINRWRRDPTRAECSSPRRRSPDLPSELLPNIVLTVRNGLPTYFRSQHRSFRMTNES